MPNCRNLDQLTHLSILWRLSSRWEVSRSFSRLDMAMCSSNRAISSKDTTLRKMKAIFISSNLNLLTSPYSISSPHLFPILSPKNLEIFAAPSPACLSTQFSVLKIHKARSLSLSLYLYLSLSLSLSRHISTIYLSLSSLHLSSCFFSHSYVCRYC